MACAIFGGARVGLIAGNPVASRAIHVPNPHPQLLHHYVDAECLEDRTIRE
jgi:hypothetical protein